VNATKSEIYTFWSIQENLLQQYRSMGLTHQSVVAAGALLVLSLFDGDWEHYRGYFVLLPSASLSVVVPLVLKTVLLVVFLYIGFRGTLAFSSVVKRREQCVSFSHDLLIMEENQKLKGYYKTGAIPLFSIFLRFIGTPVHGRADEVRPIDSEQSQNLAAALRSAVDASLPRRHFSRRFLNGQIFLVFHAIWAATFVYVAAFWVLLFVPQ